MYEITCLLGKNLDKTDRITLVKIILYHYFGVSWKGFAVSGRGATIMERFVPLWVRFLPQCTIRSSGQWSSSVYSSTPWHPRSLWEVVTLQYIYSAFHVHTIWERFLHCLNNVAAHNQVGKVLAPIFMPTTDLPGTLSSVSSFGWNFY